MNHSIFENRKINLFIFLAVFIFFCGQIQPISDFYWHISTGRWIYNSGMLPETDMFSFTSVSEYGVRTSLILKGYWVSQLLYFIIYKLFGGVGLVLLQASTFFIIAFLLKWHLIDNGNKSNALYVFLLTPLIALSCGFVELRPQVFTFIGVAFTYFFLERECVRQEAKRCRGLIVLPLLFLVWANLHPGFVLGLIIVCIYFIDGIIGVFRKGGYGFVYVMKVALVGVVSVALTLLNPNTYKPYQFILSGNMFDKKITSYINEYQSSIEYNINYINSSSVYVGFGVMSAIAIVLLCRVRRMHIRHLLLLLSFVCAGIMYYRYMYIGVVVFLFVSASYVDEDEVLNIKMLPCVVFLCFLIVLVPNIIASLKTINDGPFSSNVYGDALEFAVVNDLPQPIFHPYDWGGNILWLSDGKYKTFIDARALDYETYLGYRKVKNGQKKAVFNRYGIKTVMFYLFPPNGLPIYGLVYSMLRDDNWDLVFVGRNSIIFCRKDSAHGFVKKSKKQFTNALINKVSLQLSDESSRFNNLTIIAQLYYSLGEYGLAKEYFRRALIISPDNKFIHEWISVLDKLLGKSSSAGF